MAYEVNSGIPFPLGATRTSSGMNFSLVCAQAKAVKLCLFKGNSKFDEIVLDPLKNRSGAIWHVAITAAPEPLHYAYQIERLDDLSLKMGAIPGSLLLDPYARCVASTTLWHSETASSTALPSNYRPLGALPPADAFDWEGDEPPDIARDHLVLYEMHVRGYTKHASSGVSQPGTFLGVTEKIAHLKELGVNAVELLPVWEFNESEYNCCALSAGKHLCNYWGYSPVSFFALMNRYASSTQIGAVVNEFKAMVKALHRAGIKVILDLVFNHTAEGGFLGPTLAFKGIDPSLYYMADSEGRYLDFTGCGNTVNGGHPTVLELIIASLRYFAIEMHVDGFRFDLASVFFRTASGYPVMPSALVDAIGADPSLADCLLIAEPWDAAGLYQVGSYYRAGQRWSEWNGQYRDTVRRFIKGTPQSAGMFATRICGSQDLYGAEGSPLNSINFVTAHDGFTLYDLVSYNQKHNYSNGENNRDGLNENESWNCGVEGPTKNIRIQLLRARQMRNFHLALMLSRGIPMLHMGDEYGHTKSGNNNSWCQDDETNWFLWNRLAQNSGFFRFYRLLIQFRKTHSLLTRPSFMREDEIAWHGLTPGQPDWSSNSTLVAFQLFDQKEGADLFALFHAGSTQIEVTVPSLSGFRKWHWVVNTANPSPEDIYAFDHLPIVSEDKIRVVDHSAILLKAFVP